MSKAFKKITVGFVVQEFVTIEGIHTCINQSFVAGDQVNYEDGEGNPIEIDSTKELYESFEMKAPTSRPYDGIVFTCSGCGKHRLECCEDGPYSSEVTFIDKYGDFDYGKIDASGVVVRFQCFDCGKVIAEKEQDGFAAFDLTDVRDVVVWIQKNCEQPK